MHVVRDQYTQKKDQEKFKNIVSKTLFFKDFPSTKKIQEQTKELMEFKYCCPPCYNKTLCLLLEFFCFINSNNVLLVKFT